MMRKTIIVALAAVVLCGGAGAVAFGGGGVRRGVREVVGAGQIALVPAHNAGVGGWCLVELRRRAGAVGEEGGDCSAAKPEGAVLAEVGGGFAVQRGGGPWVKTVIAVVSARVAAVSFAGYRRIATHASALLPDHLRGATVELQDTASVPHFPRGRLIAWTKGGRLVRRAAASGSPLAFSVPVLSWSNGAPARQGICGITAHGVAGLKLVSGGVVQKIPRHSDVRGREFVNCAHSYYLLGNKWPLEAYMLLDAARPGTAPAPLPGMQPLREYHGVFIGPDGDEELARRIPGAWLVVAEGRDTSQRLTLLTHLARTLHIASDMPTG